MIGDPRNLRNAATSAFVLCLFIAGAMFMMARSCETTGPGGMDMPRQK